MGFRVSGLLKVRILEVITGSPPEKRVTTKATSVRALAGFKVWSRARVLDLRKGLGFRVLYRV